MTGRKGRVVRRPDGSVRYESRAEQSHTIDHINVKEKDRFMRGEKVRGRPLLPLCCHERGREGGCCFYTASRDRRLGY